MACSLTDVSLHDLFLENCRYGIADSLSRLDFKRFWQLAPNMKDIKELPDQTTGVIWPASKIWLD